MGETSIYNLDEIEKEKIKNVLEEVFYILEERGYNPMNQLIGYLTSGDPGYISSHKDARKKITALERTKILEVMLLECANRK